MIIGTEQPFEIDAGGLADVTCEMYSPNNGHQRVILPAKIVIARDYADLEFTCRKACYQDRSLAVESELEPWALLNILNLIPGPLVDTFSGAGFRYPVKLSLPLDERGGC